MDVRYTTVVMSVLRFQITRFKHDNYVRMYNGGALTNVINCRIGTKLHQLRLIISILICIIANLTLFLGVNNKAIKALTLPLQRQTLFD